VTTACLFMGRCLGNVRVVSPRLMFSPPQWATGHTDTPQVIGPQLVLSSEAPYYHTGLYADIGAWSALCLLCVIMGAYLKYLNRRQARRRLALGLPEQLEDMSIMTAEEANAYKRTLSEQLNAGGFDSSRLYENAFDDRTDFEWVLRYASDSGSC
jgi:hypothetical protein